MSTQFTNRQWRLPNNENKDKQSNYSMDFGGINNYISISPSVATSNQHTISTWIKSNDLTSSAIGYVFTTETTIKGIGLDEGDGSFGAGKFYYWNGASPTTVSTTAITVNNWHHIVFVFDSTANEIKFYLDGNLDKTTTVTIGTAGSIKTIGSYNGTLHYLNGKLDAFSIFDYALTDGTGGTVNQIAALYGSSSTGIGNPMSLSPKPVAYYPLGDQDAFNGANYLVPNSSLKDYVFDFIPNDYINLGDSDTFSFGNGTIDSPFSISAWVNMTDATSFVTIAKDATSNREYVIRTLTDDKLYFYLLDNVNGGYIGRIGSGTVTSYQGTWIHTVYTYNGNSSSSGVKIYLNGSQVDNTNYQGGSYTAMSNTTTSLNIGRQELLSTHANGKISNASIFNTELSSTQVETLYNNGAPSNISSLSPVSWWKLNAAATYDGSNWTIPDDSSNSNDGTSSGMTQANLVQSDLSFTSGYSPYALNFDGTNDYINIGTDSLGITSEISVSAWVKTTDNTSSFKSIICEDNISSRNWNLLVNSSRKLSFIVWNTDGSFNYLVRTNIDEVQDGNWHHIVATYDGTSNADGIKLYLDGGNVESLTATSTGIRSITSVETTIGALTGGGSWRWNGNISNCSIYNSALTSAQVTEIYNEGVPSNLNNHSAYSNLVSWWQLGSNSSFNTNWTVLDEKGSNNGTSVNMTEDAIVDGVGSYANGLSSGMGGDEVIGDAPYSTANSLSVNMDVLDRVTDTPS